MVEGLVLALVLAAQADGQAPRTVPPPPEGIDYPMAVQCAALTGVLAALERKPGLRNEIRMWVTSDRFVAWARMRAGESRTAPPSAVADIRESKSEFLAEAFFLAGGLPGTVQAAGAPLLAAHRADVEACQAHVAWNPIFVR